MGKKVLVLATHDYGGAGESAYRITKGLIKLGIEAKMMVRYTANRDPDILNMPFVGKTLLNRAILKVKNVLAIKEKSPDLDKDYCYYNVDETKVPIDSSVLINSLPFKPDIILLAWVTDFINSSVVLDLKRATNATMYWLMTDMAPITGGCHYAWNCKGYLNDCDKCPAILSEHDKFLAKRNLEIKKSAVVEAGIKVIAGSQWTSKQARQSTLFKNQEVIPVINGLIDFTIYNSNCRSIAKQVFGIGSDKKVIFTGATFTNERRKGIQYFVDALISLWDNLPVDVRNNVCILIAGNQLGENELVKKIPFKKEFIDFIKDERLLSLAYQAADVYICSSIEDSGPMMVNEALACGTPVVGFEMGFMYDMVVNGENGFKVPVADSNAMANAIKNILTLPENKFAVFSSNAIAMVKRKVSEEALAEAIKLL